MAEDAPSVTVAELRARIEDIVTPERKTILGRIEELRAELENERAKLRYIDKLLPKEKSSSNGKAKGGRKRMTAQDFNERTVKLVAFIREQHGEDEWYAGQIVNECLADERMRMSHETVRNLIRNGHDMGLITLDRVKKREVGHGPPVKMYRLTPSS